MVEQMSLQLKTVLVACQSSASWQTELPWVLLGLRSVQLEASGVSAAEMLFGSPLSLPGQFLSLPEVPPNEILDSLHLMDRFNLYPWSTTLLCHLALLIICPLSGR